MSRNFFAVKIVICQGAPDISLRTDKQADWRIIIMCKGRTDRFFTCFVRKHCVLCLTKKIKNKWFFVIFSSNQSCEQQNTEYWMWFHVFFTHMILVFFVSIFTQLILIIFLVVLPNITDFFTQLILIIFLVVLPNLFQTKIFLCKNAENLIHVKTSKESFKITSSLII